MTVALMSHSANMPGYKHNSDLDEVSSDYSYSQSMVASQGFIFSQTEPSTDMLHASSWGAITEGSQNYQDFPDNGSSHSGEAEEYIIRSGQTTPRGSRLGRSSTWAVAGLTPVSTGGHAMSRVDSSRSNGSMLSHASHLSGNTSAAFRDGSQTTGAMNGVDSCLLLDADATALHYWPGYSLGAGLDVDSATFPGAESNHLHVVPSQTQFGPDMGDHASPSSWVSFPGSITRTSSPTTVDEQWLQAQGPLSPPNSSPEIACQSPTIDFTGQVSAEDMHQHGILPDGMALPPSVGNRRDGETARNHDLYKTAQTQHDGLFHCPWEGDPSCNHKPEKLKCNYDKFVDSHLKPYRCKDHSCEGARFSSTACLLRHEREAHGLHGHGDKPFLCLHEGCERGVPGNGFPRQWNLKDHMKRVHNDLGSSGTSPTGNPPAQQSSKSRKRKTEGSESSRRSSQKNAAPKQTKAAPKPLLEQWMDHRKAVEETIRSLDNPRDMHTVQHLEGIQKRLSVMAQMSSSMAHADIAPVAGHMGFVSTG